MGKRKNKKLWNRKRKLNDDRKETNEDRKPYKQVVSSNPKMESYYAYQGLHSMQRASDSDTFVPCTNEAEMEAERLKFLNALRAPLPASFRIGQNIDPDLRDRLRKDVEEFVGTEIEIEVDKDGNAVSKPKVKKVEEDANEESGDGEVEVKMDNAAGGEDNVNTANDPAKTTTMKKLAPAKRIPYVPDGYQLSVDRRTIRKNPALQKFHEWLKVQSDAGFITRQETVSMIPPVVLSPESHHAVLDTCAAPGSKTSQLLEIISAIAPGELEPTGYVVANDCDAKRAYMLVHQLRRLNSPAVFVTAKDAQFWPMLLRGNNTTDEERAQEGMFDRVLCDVPCSGDGTARKNPGVWKHWTASSGHSLHPLQISIALNGARLTKVGGYMCYSTCSMNPIENEAVVSEILRSTDGSLELVDKKLDLHGMVARKGWTSWKVMGELHSRRQMKNKAKKNNPKMRKQRQQWAEKQTEESEDNKMDVDKKLDGEVTNEDGPSSDNKNKPDETKTSEEMNDENSSYKVEADDWEQVPPSWDEKFLKERAISRGLTEFKSYDEVPVGNRHHIRETCFPPTQEEIEIFNLQRCIRCLPQDLNTGGFFVALFKKTSPLSARARKKAEKIAAEIENKTNLLTSKKDKKEDAAVSEENTEGEDLTSKKVKLNSGEAVVPTDTDSAPISKSEVIDSAESEVKQNKKKFGFDKSESFVAVADDVLPPLIDFYGFTDSFAKGQFMARASGKSKLLYFITESVKKNLIDRGVQDRIQVINSGLRAFERRNKDDCEVSYRPCQESVHFVGPHMTKRKFIASHKDFLTALNRGAIKCDKFSEPLSTQIRELTFGAFVIALKGYENNIAKKMYLVMWRCKGDNVNCLVARPEMAGFESKMKAIPRDDSMEVGEVAGQSDEAATTTNISSRFCSIQ